MAKPTKNWPEQPVEMRDVTTLTPYPGNARTHSPEQVTQIARSITEWGFTNPILADEAGLILAGHGRRLAALELGLKTVPVRVARGWSEDQKRAYIIADNKLALNAGWDIGTLSLELGELEAADFDLDLIGFSADDLTRLQTDLDQKALEGIGGDGPKSRTPWQDNRMDRGDAVSFSLVMATEARKVLQEAIAVMKDKAKMETSAEALVAICKEWMGAQ